MDRDPHGRAAPRAGRLPRAAATEADVLSFDFVLSPSLPREAGEWNLLMELRRQQVRLLADSYAEAGLVPVIDDVVDRAMLDLYRKYLRLRPLRYVLLVPQLAVAHARNAGRERSREALTMEMLARFDEELRSTMDGAGLRLDTSSLTADETADQILGHLSEAVAFA